MQHHGGLSHEISFSRDSFVIVKSVKRFTVVSEGFDFIGSTSVVDLFVIHSPEAVISVLSEACNMDILKHGFDHVLRCLPVAGPVQCSPGRCLPIRVKLPIDATHVFDVGHRSSPSLLFKGGLEAAALLDLREPSVVLEVVFRNIVVVSHLV